MHVKIENKDAGLWCPFFQKLYQDFFNTKVANLGALNISFRIRRVFKLVSRRCWHKIFSLHLLFVIEVRISVSGQTKR